MVTLGKCVPGWVTNSGNAVVLCEAPWHPSGKSADLAGSLAGIVCWNSCHGIDVQD